jgi:hypothetical protein
MEKGRPFLPPRCCLKITGPGEHNFIPIQANIQKGKVSNIIIADPTRSYNSFREIAQETPGALLKTIMVLPPITSREGLAIDVRMKSVESHASTPSASHAPIVS